jgi:geranylgeranyl diphosphate synthase type II
VHYAYGERLAVLAGDALIVLAFQIAGRARSALADAPGAALMETVAGGVGMPGGIVAGQAWECEPRVSLRDYQRAKTGVCCSCFGHDGGAQVAGGATPKPGAPGRLPGRGLPGGRRHPRCGGQPRTWASPSAVMLALLRPARHRTGLEAADRASSIATGRRCDRGHTRLPRRANMLRALVPPSPSGWCRVTAGRLARAVA